MSTVQAPKKSTPSRSQAPARKPATPSASARPAAARSAAPARSAASARAAEGAKPAAKPQAAANAQPQKDRASVSAEANQTPAAPQTKTLEKGLQQNFGSANGNANASAAAPAGNSNAAAMGGALEAPAGNANANAPAANAPAPAPANAPAGAAAPAGQPTPPRFDGDFQYNAPPIPNVNGANFWTPGSSQMSGSQANETINKTYDSLDRQFQQYMPGPPVANWMTYGKYASREAGSQIDTLENTRKAMNGSAEAAVRAGGAMTDLDTLNQSTRVGLSAAGDEASRLNPVKAALKPAEAAGEVAGGAYGQTAYKLHGALVEGNTGIYNNMAPAYDAFLKGESKGGPGGMQALKDAGYTPGSPKDSQGFITQGFSKYREARDVADAYQKETDPAKKAALLQKRDGLMNEGNLMFGIQEQMNILQKPTIFGDPQIQNMMGGINGQMSFREAPTGRFDLLPQGTKNWTNFQDRMGFKTVPQGTEGAIPIKDHQGNTNFYAPDRTQKGTIVDFFESNLNGNNAAKLMSGSPSPLASNQAPTTNTGAGLLEGARGFDNGNAGQVVSGGIKTVAGVPTDIAQAGADGLQSVGKSNLDAGANRMVNGTSTLERVAGTAQAVAGGVADTAGDYLEAGAHGVKAAADWTADTAGTAVNWSAGAAKSTWNWLTSW